MESGCVRHSHLCSPLDANTLTPAPAAIMSNPMAIINFIFFLEVPAELRGIQGFYLSNLRKSDSVRKNCKAAQFFFQKLENKQDCSLWNISIPISSFLLSSYPWMLHFIACFTCANYSCHIVSHFFHLTKGKQIYQEKASQNKKQTNKQKTCSCWEWKYHFSILLVVM